MSTPATPEAVHQQCDETMQQRIDSVQYEMSAIRTGRANPMMLDRVSVDYYGTPTPVRQMANISVQDGTTLMIQPYDRGTLGEIEKAISKSDLNLPPNNDGNIIRLAIPPLTEERRKEMVKTVKKIGEEGKVAIRNVRRDATNDLDKVNKSENLPEDVVKGWQDDIQKLTDKYTAMIDSMVSAKEEEVMQV